MIRTTFSVCALFGGLLLVSKSLQETNASEPPRREPPSAVTQQPPRFGSLKDEPELGAPGGASDTPALADSVLDTPAKPIQTGNSAEEPSSGLEEDAGRDVGPPAVSTSLSADDEFGTDDQSQARELTPELTDLRDRLKTCLKYYYENPENTNDRSVWGVMHALIAYGVDTQVIAGNRKVNAIGWVCYNGNCKGQRLFYVQNNKLQARIGPGVQGHPGQFLAMLAQSRVKTDFPLKVEGHEFNVQDLIEMEKLGCNSNVELTFKLIGLSHYLDTDTTWKNEHGEDWSLPRLIKEELAQPVIKGACGGTHRMMGFTYAIKKREKEGKPIEGEWRRARKFVDAYHEYTLSLQNKDGSMSTEWFKGRGDYGEAPRRVETTGHILEWLVQSLPEERLREPEVVKGMSYLTNLLSGNRQWEIGPKGHALHALMIYDQRVFGGKPGQFAPVVATSPSSTKSE